MKASVLVLILAVVDFSCQQAAPPVTNEDQAAAAADCIKESSVSPAVVQKAFMEGVFAEDNDFKCFIKCMFIKMGDMTEAGQLLPQNMELQAPPGIDQAQASQVINTCKEVTGTDPCDTAFKVAKCLTEQATKLLGH